MLISLLLQALIGVNGLRRQQVAQLGTGNLPSPTLATLANTPSLVIGPARPIPDGPWVLNFAASNSSVKASRLRHVHARQSSRASSGGAIAQPNADETEVKGSEEGDSAKSDAPQPSDKKKEAEDSEKGGSAKSSGRQELAIGLEDLRYFFYVMAPLGIMSFAIFECVHKKWIGIEFEEELELPPIEATKMNGLFHDAWTLVRPYCCENPRSFGRYAFCVLVGLSLLQLLVGFAMNLWQGEFWNSFENKDAYAFWHLMRAYAAIVVTWIMFSTYHAYIRQMLEIDWRTQMTSTLRDQWLKGQAFYRLQLDQRGDTGTPDNPDQRISEDVAMFVTSVLSLSFGLMSSVGNFVVFLPVLLQLSPTYAFDTFYCPGWLVFLALAYSLAGSLAAHFIGRELIRIGYARQRYEADFRYRVVQIRDNSEAISLYHAEDVETRILDRSFQRIVQIFWDMMLYQKRLGFFTSFYFITGWMFPFCVLAPSYFSGQIKMGHLFQISSALGQVRDAFDWFISTYPTLAEFRATTERLLLFKRAMDRAVAKGGQLTKSEVEASEDGPLLEVHDAEVHLPDGTLLWKAAGLKVLPGQGILLSATEGTGKSCFFRAMAGIWPYVEGGITHAVGTEEEGNSSGQVLFLPQRSYIPQGPLRQAVAYPHNHETYGDAAISEALRIVRLDKVVPAHALGTEANWAMMLSGGEQQRLAIARVLLARPRVVFLDESMSQVGEDGTKEIYALLRERLPKGSSFVSISHEVELMIPLHDVHYVAQRDPESKANHWVLAA